MPLSLAPRSSLVDAAIAARRCELERCTWKVGERIPPEAALAETLGVSRNRERNRVIPFVTS